jgi:hypothetical protein
MWGAGLSVAAAAAIATAHGSFQVAHAAGVPTPIAALYPAITDGLALVAYTATCRLAVGGRRYAWTVVVLAAGLSGLAQAAWLAGGVQAAPAGLRLGVGAWPALAAAVVAHLLFLLGGGHPQPSLDTAVQPPSTIEPQPYNPEYAGGPPDVEPTADGDDAACASAVLPRDRAAATARGHRDRTGCLPSVSELAIAADVSRGTAATALRGLRRHGDAHARIAVEPSEGLQS